MPSTNFRRIGLATMATSLVIGGSVAAAGTAYAEADFDFSRVQGENRYDTSAKAAEAFGTANTVIVASGEPGRYPDALAANYLAGIKNAPVLLTKKGQTPDQVKEAILDSGARNIIIVGGEGVISAEQEQTLGEKYNVSRLAGADRFGTASEIIAEGGEAAGDTALLATGMNFPDALGGGPVAFAENMPLAITKVDDMPDNVIEELKAAGISKVLVLGGESAVSQAVVDELKDKGITVEKRFAGRDRAETSTMLAEYAMSDLGFTDTAVNVASGYIQGDGADALGGAALTGKQERALLITKSEDTPGEAVLAFLGEVSDTLTGGVIFGGEAALTTGAEVAMEKAVLGSGAQIGNELYDSVEEAVAAAEAGDTITVFGQDNPGFTVDKAGITIQGEKGAALTGGVTVRGVDDVTISNLTIEPTDVGGQVAGVYLDNAEGIVIKGISVTGAGDDTGAGVINATNGEDEIAEISNSKFVELRQGVYANPSATFTVEDNLFRGNLAGSANDAATVIRDNRFLNNEEGIGLGAADVTVEGNSFGDNTVYVKDWTADADNYDLEAMITANSFDNEVTVTEDGSAIIDKPAAE